MSNPDRKPTDALVEHALGLRLSELPSAVQDQAHALLADTVGVLLSASRKRAVGTALEAFPSRPDGTVTIVGHGKGATPEQAAFINGVGGHDTELDDSHSPSRTHAAAVIVPAALAAAEAGEATGADLLAGIVAAYDVQVRVSKAMGVQDQFDRGFHPTAVCGSIGAAVAAGRILGLDADQLRFCISLATSQSSGLLTFEDDPSHMVKSFQTGIAARNGLYAALLAQRGFMASPDALAGRHNVLTPFGGPDPSLDQLTDALGERYDICETSLKRHACCGQTHSAIDALLTLQERHGFSADDIERVDVQLAHAAVPIIDGNPLWTHNLQYVLSVAAREGRVGQEHFEDAWTSDAETRALSQRVTVRGSDALQARFPSKKGAIVEVATPAGTFEQEYPAPRGNPEQPLTGAELEAKFTALATAALTDQEASQLWEQLTGLGAEDDLSEFFKRLGAA